MEKGIGRGVGLHGWAGQGHGELEPGPPPALLGRELPAPGG